MAVIDTVKCIDYKIINKADIPLPSCSYYLGSQLGDQEKVNRQF